jgi:hypothetical protein
MPMRLLNKSFNHAVSAAGTPSPGRRRLKCVAINKSYESFFLNHSINQSRQGSRNTITRPQAAPLGVQQSINQICFKKSMKYKGSRDTIARPPADATAEMIDW